VKGDALYGKFHGRPHRQVTQANFHVPKELVYLGDAVAIEYACDKLNGGGDGKKAIYRHEFAKGAILCMDETGKRQLYVLGMKIYVNERGIVK